MPARPLYLLFFLARLAAASNWVVVTSIFGPTDTIRALAALPEWSVVVVGDVKTPSPWASANVTYLDVAAQAELGYAILPLLPFNSYARKNVGYLYAVAHGATAVYDTDDDNEPIGGLALLPTPAAVKAIRPHRDAAHANLVNPYAAFGAPSVWPRGYPLRAVVDAHRLEYEPSADRTCAVQQATVDLDPDVDAIFRLTRGAEIGSIRFDRAAPPVALAHGVYAPWNSQSTYFTYDGLWALMVPATTPFRVCDIWRAYVAQRLLWAIDAHVCFVAPAAEQVRNAHDYLDDFLDEHELYRDAERLTNALSEWAPPAGAALPEAVVSLWQHAAATGFVKDGDAALARAWVDDLTAVGYAWPHVSNPAAALAPPAPVVADAAAPAAAAAAAVDAASGLSVSAAGTGGGGGGRKPAVLVTGITGMIGSQVAAALVATGRYRVVGLARYRSNLRNLAPILHAVDLRVGDILDAFFLRDLVGEVRPAYVFHFAAQAINGVSYGAPAATLDTNVAGTLNVLEAMLSAASNATAARPATLLLAGSSTEYGAAADVREGVPLDESTPFMPVSPYGASKVAAEMLATSYARAHPAKLRCVTARLFNHFGSGGTEHVALQEFARQVAMIEAGLQPPVLLHGNLAARRDYSDVADTSPVLVALAETGVNGEAYNVASGAAFSTREVLEHVVAQATVPVALRADPSRLRPYDEKVLLGDSRKLQRLTGWTPTVNLTRAAGTVLGYWREEVAARYPGGAAAASA